MDVEIVLQMRSAMVLYLEHVLIQANWQGFLVGGIEIPIGHFLLFLQWTSEMDTVLYCPLHSSPRLAFRFNALFVPLFAGVEKRRLYTILVLVLVSFRPCTKSLVRCAL